MRVLVTGSRGQVGSEVARVLEGLAEVTAHDRTTLDLADAAAIAARVRESRPDVIVNAAAYTAVDQAESDEPRAHAVNAAAPAVLAAEARRLGAVLLHFSTDYVFDGNKAAPYIEEDATAPLGAYGRTKLEGERAIAASGCDHAILRTSWVYGPHGKNFMLTMLRLGRERGELRVVDDQHGAPTSSLQLAALTRALLAPEGRIDRASLDRVRAGSGIYHATAAGETTWCGFARAIFEAGPAGMPKPRVVAIATKDYPTPARRPANSRLSNEKLARNFGVRIPDWRNGLAEALSRLG
jgi:dTDP-4-dehydrorhamnose reductase